MKILGVSAVILAVFVVCFLGFNWLDFKALPENQPNTFESVHLEAEKGDPEAQYVLGHYYFIGDGVGQNRNEAAKWFLKAANRGNIYAQVSLGVCYQGGVGVAQDLTEALKWYRKAADQGYADGEFHVAGIYYDGLGVKQDKTESLKWMERAAKQGKPLAQFLAGLEYFVGMDVKMNDKKGVELIEKAANQGEPAALHYLSAAYFLGKGKQQDYLEAYIWELVFMDSSKIMIPDNPDSLKARIAEVEQKLTPEQIKMGKDEAQKLKGRLSKLPRYSASD